MAFAGAVVLALPFTGAAPGSPRTHSAARYIVVLKDGRSSAGIAAVTKAGGRIVGVNKIGIASVLTSRPSFQAALRASGAVAGVAPDASFGLAPGAVRSSILPRALTRASAHPTTTEAAACASLFSVPVTSGPDPLAACQWDLRAISANPGSYAVDKGQGARIGDIDTGIDLTHPEFSHNLDLATSCSFIYATTPTSNPSEQVTPGDCSNKSAIQDLAGHGTHTAGIIAAQIDGHGTSGVAPDASIVALKAGTEQGYFFTDSVVNALVYAGDITSTR